jgi:serine/threonine protein kinase/tetratricopeptide (TPR) repeat protein
MYDDRELAATVVTPDLPAADALPAHEAAGPAETGDSSEVQLRRSDAPAPNEPSADVTEVIAAMELPAVGTCFVGFGLRAVLGRGAFGQVYLAEQGDLANRYVALKVAPDIFGESQRLAQLQHTNIVPIYSLHRADPFQAVCMPYFGSTTLADIVHESHQSAVQPSSGKMLVDTVESRKRSTQPILDSAPGLAIPAPRLPADNNATAVNRTAATAGALQQLEHMSYVEAVLWIGERIADGLAHAHEQGILHHDLKPANILLTEDGQPMLLDFNLAEDTKPRGRVTKMMAGGTLPYMAPEHLEVFRQRSRRVDLRSDIYSLGVILHELLAGRHPFPHYPRLSSNTLGNMIEDRHKPIPSLRSANPAVSPAAASIVNRCLEADPARRYHSARELQEDLRRQRCHLPLKYAPEPSLRERASKWVRRHPRLTSSTGVGTMFMTVLLVLAMAFAVRSQQLARFESQDALRRFREEARTAQFLLYNRNADPAQLEEGMSRCKEALAPFQVLDNPDWLGSPVVHNLTEDERERLRDEAGEVLYLLSRAAVLHAVAYSEPGSREERLARAADFNRLAEVSFGPERTPRALWEQRAQLANLRGLQREAETLAAQAKDVPLRTPRDRYLIAHQLAMNGRLREALEMLTQVTQDDPQNFSAWFVRADCSYELLQDTSAVACYNACLTLRPEFHWTWFNRGLAHLRLRNYRQAAADFERVIALRPDLADGYVHRGLAKEGMHAYRDAVADYSKALDAPGASTRVYFLRSAARSRAGDAEGAQRDWERGRATEPTDELGWIARGNARREREPRDALADYEQALKINPRSFDALQNKAALLSDKFADDAASLAVMEEAVRLYPESVLTRGGRGVLLARAGRRAAAVDDAQACLLIDSGPATQYQVACIYALTSKTHEADRLTALPLVSAALRAGFGLGFVDHDPDLDRLRPLPEFQRLLTAAKALHAGPR